MSDTNIFGRFGREESCFFAGKGSLCDEICPCFSQLWTILVVTLPLGSVIVFVKCHIF